MAKRKSKITSLPEEYRRILHNQSIDENGPGTILRDFEVLLDFIGPTGIEVSAGQSLPSIKLLPELNRRLSHPVTVRLKRPQLKSYPNISGLYMVLRATGVALIKRKGAKRLLELDEPVLESWRKLNPVEKYFNLLESWLIRGKPEVVGSRDGFLSHPFGTCLEVSQALDPHASDQTPADIIRRLGYHLKYAGFNIALMESFGFVSLRESASEEGKGWVIEEMHSTAFGRALLGLLSINFLETDFLFDIFSDQVEGLSGNQFGKLQPVLQPFFPEWRNNLYIPRSGEGPDGIYVFKVSLGRVWRRIAIQGKAYLDSLARSILDVFDFDYDHLYRFTFTSRFGSAQSVNHPYMEDEPPLADEVAIKELPLVPGDSMEYVYDFGDHWEFEVELERVEPPDVKMKKPVLLESHGKSPRQYHSEWEE